MRFEDVFGLWQEGERRLARADPADKPAIERVTDELVLRAAPAARRPVHDRGAGEPLRQRGDRLGVRRRDAGGARRTRPRGTCRSSPAPRSRATRARRATTASGRRSRGRGSPSCDRCAASRRATRSAVLVAGAADHDLVLLDRDLDRAVAGPVLGVYGVVLDGGVEPQAVALLAVVEGRLERRRRSAAGGARRGGRAAARLGRSSDSSSDSSSGPRSSSSSRPWPRRPRARPRSARRPRPADRSRRRSRRRRWPRRRAGPRRARARA